MIMANPSVSTPPAATKAPPAPKAAAVKCDVPGCGELADRCTDGSEVDEHPNPSPDGTKRPALPNINTCVRHRNWAHSDDARRFAAMDDNYKARK
jgi:hypothetical protein